MLLLATAVPTLLVARATTFSELMVCAFFFGIAGNSFSIGIAWNAAWSARERQGFALGVFGAGNVGASVTKLIGPALIALVPRRHHRRRSFPAAGASCRCCTRRCWS